MASNSELQERRHKAVPRGVSNSLAVYAERAANAEIWDVEGRRYIDFASGISVLNTGHVHPRVRAAIAQGASQLIDESAFAASAAGTPYLAPQVLIDVNHSMAIMREETFGPAVGIMRVSSDEEAVRLMNDSDFGLTAAIFSKDAARAEALGDALETGTVFLNRCDYLDPALAWTGVKSSGRGCTLSRVGFEQLTRPKSYHFKVTI